MPIGSFAPAKRAGAMARPSDMARSNPLVIVVDDDAAVRNSLKFSLEIDGFAVRIHASAEELLRTDDLSACQCLIVDQEMPGTTGLELVATLRKQGVQVPAVLVSGRLTPALTRQALAAGIAIFEKPLLGNEFIELIRSAVGRAGQ